MRLQAIPRPSRLRAVWLAYWTQLRWWSWPLWVGMLAIGCWWATYSWKPRTHNMPTYGQRKITEVGADGREVVRYESFIVKETPIILFSSCLPSAPEPAPKAHVDLTDGGVVRRNEPQWDKLRSLTLNRGWASCQPLWTPGAMPLLESLVVWDPVQDDSIVRLCELYDLKALTLVNAGNLTTTAMERLALEPRLEYMNLSVDHSTIGISLPGESQEMIQQREVRKLKTLQRASKVEWPESLKTLVYNDFSGVKPARLEEWQRLPRLSSLATHLLPDADHRLSEEAIALLKQFPKLRQLFLHEPSQSESELAIVQQHRLPHLNVRPWRYDPTRGRRAAVLLVCGFFVLMFLHSHLIKQFAMTANGLRPGFATPHLLFAAGVFAATAAVLFGFSQLADCSWHAALGVCGAAIVIQAGGSKLMRKILGRYSAMFISNIGMQFQSAFILLMTGPALVTLFGAEIDWFLRGHYPWVSVSLLVAALWGVFDWGTWLIGMSRALEEVGCANVPLGTFDQKGWTEWHKTAAAVQATGREKAPLNMRRQDRRLDQMVRDVAAGKKFTPLELWLLAVPMRYLDWLFMMTSIIAMTVIPLGVLAYFLEGWSFEGSGKFSWPLGIQFIVMGLVMPMSQWVQRYPMLPLERLRPTTREDWTKTWFGGVFREFAPLTVLMFCGMLTLHLAGWGFGQTVFESMIAFIAIVGVSALIVSIGMLAMTLHSRWWLIGAVALFSIGLGGASIATDMKFDVTGANGPLVACLIGLIYVAAISLWIAAQWRWREWELGLVEP